jgi:hypothetical protein
VVEAKDYDTWAEKMSADAEKEHAAKPVATASK